MIDYLSALSKHGSGQRLHGLSGVGIVLGGLWVVLKLEWNPRTPPIEFCGDLSSFHFFQPHHHLFLLLSLCGNFFIGSDGGCFSPITIFSSFLAFAAASFSVPAVDALPVFLLYFGCLVSFEC